MGASPAAAGVRDLVAQLSEPFAREVKGGYQDSAVFGGLKQHVTGWCRKGWVAAPERREAFEHLVRLFADYEALRPKEREVRIRDAKAILVRMDENGAPAPKARRPRKSRAGQEEAHSAAGHGPHPPPTPIPHAVDDPLAASVQYAKHVGPKMGAALERLGIYTIRDLLTHYPRRHEDRSKVRPFADLATGEPVTVEGRVEKVSEFRPRPNLTITKVLLGDGSGYCTLVVFNQTFLRQRLKPGTRIIATGKPERHGAEWEMAGADYEILGEQDTLNAGRIVPVYPLTERVSQRYLRRAIWMNLEAHGDQLADLLPAPLREHRGLAPAPTAVRQYHFPDDANALDQARRRLAFEELFLLSLVMALSKRGYEGTPRSAHYHLPPDAIDRFAEKLPFTLTHAQRRAMEDVLNDVERPFPMHRLIDGDVGSGKTVVAAFAVYCAALSGHQTAVMVPTEILADQHVAKFTQFLAPHGLSIQLLVGRLGKREKDAVRAQAAAGDTQLLIGTHALIQEAVAFQNLGLVIIDEQHKFGSQQRAELRGKGGNPDLLVMTATPIPRTLAQALYGDLDLSVLDELPPGRKPIKSYLRSPDRLDRVYEFVRAQVGEGRQVYVVCPAIEESEVLEVKAAVEEAKRLQAEVFPDLAVGLVHGRMKAADRDAAMTAFRAGTLQVLISTTVIEVGVDVPNATVMVVLNADRFGLAQLHQLRGRVGRGAHQSYCIFIAGLEGPAGQERLEAVTESADGFAVAEADLMLRGVGTFYGDRQHGLSDLKVADVIRDRAMLEEARAEAQALLAEDPALAAPDHERLRARLAGQSEALAGLLH